jgi:hypothetical protein
VQQRLANNRVIRRNDQKSIPSPLTGLIHDDTGDRLTPAHARGKSGRRYRYYVSARLQASASGTTAVRRLAAAVIEDLVIDRLRLVMAQPLLQWQAALPVIRRIELHVEAVVMHLTLPEHSGWQSRVQSGDRWHVDDGGLPVITVPGKLKLRGGKTLLITPTGNGSVGRPRPDQALIAGLKRAHAELRRHNIHLRKSDGNLTEAKGIADPYLRRLAACLPGARHAACDSGWPPSVRTEAAAPRHAGHPARLERAAHDLWIFHRTIRHSGPVKARCRT